MTPTASPKPIDGKGIRGLYAITDPILTPDAQLLPACEAALAGGARILQYRNKIASLDTQYQQARALRTLCQRYQALLIINDSPSLAQAVGADGVHVGQHDTPLTTFRQHQPNAVVGVSCHNNLALAQQAEQGGADYIALGRFFPSRTKPGAPPADIATLKQAHQNLRVPIVAIGGVTPHNAPGLIEAGASAVAVIHALFASNDPATIEQNARAFSSLFPT